MDLNGPSLSGELRLFCSVTAAYSHLPPILDRFRAEHPQVEINSPPATPPMPLKWCSPVKQIWLSPAARSRCPPVSILHHWV